MNTIISHSEDGFAPESVNKSRSYRYFVSYAFRMSDNSWGYGNSFLELGVPAESQAMVRAIEAEIRRLNPDLMALALTNLTLLGAPSKPAFEVSGNRFVINQVLSDMPFDTPVLVKQRENPVPFVAVREQDEPDSINRVLAHPKSSAHWHYIPLADLEGWFPVMDAFGLGDSLEPDWRNTQPAV
jgi:hypothetical protein